MGGIFEPYSYQPSDDNIEKAMTDRREQQRLCRKYQLDIDDIEKDDRKKWRAEHGPPAPGGFGSLFE